MNNIIAIVGRPNVGKSSLFNKLVGSRKAIVHDEAGVTRDRLYHDVHWTDKTFKIIDTGGIEISDKPFQDQIKIQAKIAIEEASVIFFLVDGKEGLTYDDDLIARILRKSNKKIILLANKLEGNKDMDPAIWSLGFEKIFPISALHGDGIGDALDHSLKFLDFSDQDADENLKLAIIGRPNAGKSSLLNILSGKKRSIVSEISGTTRDSINENIDINGTNFTVVDTAGINRKSKLVESVDHYALARAKSAIYDSGIILLVIDNEREIAHFDAVVGGYAFERNKPIIIVVNKWDIATKDTMTMRKKEILVRNNFKYLSWAPLVFISAKTGLRIDKLKEKVIEVKANKSKMIKTNLLNEVMTDLQIQQPAQSVNGGRLNIKFVKMVEARVPTFIFWVNRRKYLHFTYKRFLENKLREHFGFEGVPLILLFRESKGKEYDKRF